MNIIAINVTKILSIWSLEKKILFALHAKAKKLADCYLHAVLSARGAVVKRSKHLPQHLHVPDVQLQVVRAVVFNEKKH